MAFTEQWQYSPANSAKWAVSPSRVWISSLCFLCLSHQRLTSLTDSELSSHVHKSVPLLMVSKNFILLQIVSFHLIHYLLCPPLCSLFFPFFHLSAILAFFWQADMARSCHVFSLTDDRFCTHGTQTQTEKTWEWEYCCISESTVKAPIHLGTITCLHLYWSCYL